MTRERFAAAMWDFSWLVRRDSPECEYLDWEAMLGGLAARGYNCVRIDAFPHLVAKVATGQSADTFRILPQKRHFPWGNHHPVEVNPLGALKEFIRIAAKNGIRVGLSSWFIDDATHARDAVCTPEDLTACWAATLGTLAEANLLGRIEWVDLCNEFPLGEWLPGAYRFLFNRRWPNLAPLLRPWNPEQRARVNRFFCECIPALRASFPTLRYTFSFQRIGFHNVRQCDVDAFDLAEVHVWLAEMVFFNLVAAHLPGLVCLPGGLALHRTIGPPVFDFAKTSWVEQLRARMADWADWGKANHLPFVTTEGWGPINYRDRPGSSDGKEWRWVKEVCAEGVASAIDLGWRGICTSNFCQPHFPGMWNDRLWHERMTALIRG